jgi:transposase
MVTATEVSANGLVDTKRKSVKRKRRQWSEAEKRRVVSETLEPGSSVSIVARRHDVNANQVFKWRRELVPGAQREPAPAVVESVTLMPVEIAPERAEPRHRGSARRSGTIEITLACGARICVRGEVSSEMLQQVIELLR